MLFVPVRSSKGIPLMPTHPARARELVRKGKALRKFHQGFFYLQLVDRAQGELQPIGGGIDPGSKKEGFTVKSKAHTYLNLQADAVTWVGQAVGTRRNLRRSRRSRKTPCRKNRENRKRGGLPPSTKARWQWKLRLSHVLCFLYPVSCFVVEDVCAVTRQGKRRWNASFSPLEVGKAWFYQELGKLAEVRTKKGWETKQMRDALSLKKSKKKTAEVFEAHCVDSWVLANSYTGGATPVDNRRLFCVTPLRFHRRALHRQSPQKGGKRPPYGGTRSLGFKRGNRVLHPKYGLCYVGGNLKGRLSLHSPHDGKRLCQNAFPKDCLFLSFSSFRARPVTTCPPVNDRGSAAGRKR